MLRRTAAAALPPLVVVAATLAAWQAVVWIWRPSEYLFPGPLVVLAALRDNAGVLLAGARLTGTAAALGFLVAAGAGVLAGSLLSASRFLMRGLYPLATLLQMVPLVAIAPLLVIWFGYGQPMVVASAAIVSVFPVLAATLDGVRGTDRGLLELFDTLGAAPFQRWWKLQLPAAIPSIVTGLRIAAGLAVIGAVVGEFVGAFAGEEQPLGLTILSAMRENRTDLVFAAIAMAAAVGFLLFGAVSLLGWLVLRRWHDSAVRSGS